MGVKVYTKGFEELERKISKIATRTTPLMKRSVYVGAGTVADAVRANLQSRIKKPTGQLESGLEINKIAANGGYVGTSVGFEGYGTYRGKEGPLATIAAVLESGRSDQEKRTKTHFFSDAVKASRQTALLKMAEEFEKNLTAEIEKE